MKYMLSWKIKPDTYKAVVKAFLAGGAPVPSGITLVGRWHAPGSSYGWLLVEGDDIEAVAEHVSEWSSLAELSVTPVIDDTEASNALTKAQSK